MHEGMGGREKVEVMVEEWLQVGERSLIQVRIGNT